MYGPLGAGKKKNFPARPRKKEEGNQMEGGKNKMDLPIRKRRCQWGGDRYFSRR